MVGQDLAFAPAWQIRDMVRRRELSPVELVELFLNRIEALNPRLNAYLTVDADSALAQAQDAETAVMKGAELGPLHGVPISIKDMLLTRSIRTTFGSLVFKDRVPDKDAIVAERLRKAGAIFLGKTNVPEFGVSGMTENRLGNACRNPWDPRTASGGSSGGAASAQAAGLCSLASGGDGAGSIRAPASFCGVYGIKPTQWRVPAGGSAINLFQQLGPLARSVKDAAIVLQVMSGHDSGDPLSIRDPIPDFVSSLGQGIQGLKVAWSPDLGFAAVDPEVIEITSRAATVFEELGCTVEAPDMALEDPLDAFWTILSSKVATSYGHLLDQHADELTPYARDAIEMGLRVTGIDYGHALQRCFELQTRLRDVLDRYDLLLTPATGTVAFPTGQPPDTIAGRKVNNAWGFASLSIAFNISQQPAASIPCGFSKKGMPVGLQIVGRERDEAAVLRASAAYEEARPWALHRPLVS